LYSSRSVWRLRRRQGGSSPLERVFRRHTGRSFDIEEEREPGREGRWYSSPKELFEKRRESSICNRISQKFTLKDVLGEAKTRNVQRISLLPWLLEVGRHEKWKTVIVKIQ